jgi:hypothetical protein
VPVATPGDKSWQVEVPGRQLQLRVKTIEDQAVMLIINNIKQHTRRSPGVVTPLICNACEITHASTHVLNMLKAIP